MGDEVHDRLGPAAVILLAAGASSRLGHPKQLVRLEGRSLVRRAAEEALAVGFGPLTLVLGARADVVRAELVGLDLHIVENEGWSEGIASSLRVGLGAAREQAPALQRVMILLCDQPAVDRSLLERLVLRHRQGPESATACSVEGRPGAPAIFEAEHFEALQHLRGDAGAREILRDPYVEVACVEYPRAAWDIDTEEDLPSG